jgi:hypothetical protein
MKIEKAYTITTRFNQFTLCEGELKELYVALGNIFAEKKYELRPEYDFAPGKRPKLR